MGQESFLLFLCPASRRRAFRLLPLRCVPIEKQTSELLQQLESSYFLFKLGIHSDVKVVIYFLDLQQVLVLHFSPRKALLAGCSRVWEENLVDDDVPDIDLLLGELDSQPLRLIHAQELRNAHGHESRALGVLELLVDFLDLGLHAIQCLEDFLLDLLWVHLLATTLSHDLCEHATELLFQLYEFEDTLLQNFG